VVCQFDSRSKGCGFESHLIQITRWKWGQIYDRTDSCTQSGSFENKKNTGSQMWLTKKKKKNRQDSVFTQHCINTKFHK